MKGSLYGLKGKELVCGFSVLRAKTELGRETSVQSLFYGQSQTPTAGSVHMGMCMRVHTGTCVDISYVCAHKHVTCVHNMCACMCT